MALDYAARARQMIKRRNATARSPQRSTTQAGANAAEAVDMGMIDPQGAEWRADPERKNRMKAAKAFFGKDYSKVWGG